MRVKIIALVSIGLGIMFFSFSKPNSKKNSSLTFNEKPSHNTKVIFSSNILEDNQ